MSLLPLAAAVLVFAAQGEAPPPPPESPPIAEEAAPPATPAPDALDDSAPPEPGDAPAAPPAAPPAAKAEKGGAEKNNDVELSDPGGMSPFATLAAQIVTGCGVACVVGFLPAIVSLIPFVGGVLSAVLGGLMCIIAPPIVGTAEALLGDLIGGQRGTLLWTILGAYGGYFIGGLLTTGIWLVSGALLSGLVGGGVAGLLALVQASGGDPFVLIPALLAGYAAALVGIVIIAVVSTLLAAVVVLTAGSVTPAIVYMLTAEDKKPGDGDFRFPGFSEPAHKIQEAALPRGLGELRHARAMAY